MTVLMRSPSQLTEPGSVMNVDLVVDETSLCDFDIEDLKKNITPK